MKNTTTLLFLLFFAVIGHNVYSQQEALITQYMFNGLSINPAMAGSDDNLSLTGLIRSQWVGIDGAPNTQVFSIHSPMRSDNYALGLNVTHDKIAVTGRTNISPSYAYRLHFSNGAILSLGIQASIINYKAGLTSLNPKETSDIAFSEDINTWMLNFGFGAYYYTNKYYIGLSAPMLLNNNYSNSGDKISEAKFERHYYLTVGYVFDLDKNYHLKPSVLLRYVESSYFTTDFNLNLYYKRYFGVGISYRTSESISALFELFINDDLMIGYAYDYILSDIQMATSGSHEIMINYLFPHNHKRVVTPRYF